MGLSFLSRVMVDIDDTIIEVPDQPGPPSPLVAVSGENGGRVMVDIDDTIIEVHGYTKQGSVEPLPSRPPRIR